MYTEMPLLFRIQRQPMPHGHIVQTLLLQFLILKVTLNNMYKKINIRVKYKIVLYRSNNLLNVHFRVYKISREETSKA